MNEPACHRCRFWVNLPGYDLGDGEERGNFGECRRYPPSLRDDGTVGSDIGEWPLTEKGAYCGEFEDAARKRRSPDLPYGMDREQLTRYVLEWCWLSGDCPAGVHDAAAILLGEPSMAPGFADIQFRKWLEMQSVDSTQEHYSHDSLKPPMQGQI